MQVDTSKAHADAQNLYKAGEKKWGTDEASFNLVMASRNRAQLCATFEAYRQVSLQISSNICSFVIMLVADYICKKFSSQRLSVGFLFLFKIQ